MIVGSCDRAATVRADSRTGPTYRSGRARRSATAAGGRVEADDPAPGPGPIDHDRLPSPSYRPRPCSPWCPRLPRGCGTGAGCSAGRSRCTCRCSRSAPRSAAMRPFELSARQERTTGRGARWRSVARHWIATLPTFTPVPTGRVELHARRRAVHLDPQLGRVARSGRLIAQPGGRSGDQTEAERPFAAEVHLKGRNAVRVLAASDPGPAAVLCDPELHARGAVWSGVIDGILERELGAGDQKRSHSSARRHAAWVGGQRGARRGHRGLRTGPNSWPGAVNGRILVRPRRSGRERRRAFTPARAVVHGGKAGTRGDARDRGARRRWACPEHQARVARGPFGEVDDRLGQVARLVLDVRADLERLGRPRVPVLAANQGRSPDRHLAPLARPFGLVFHRERLEVEVLVADLPAHRPPGSPAGRPAPGATRAGWCRR